MSDTATSRAQTSGKKQILQHHNLSQLVPDSRRRGNINRGNITNSQQQQQQRPGTVPANIHATLRSSTPDLRKDQRQQQQQQRHHQNQHQQQQQQKGAASLLSIGSTTVRLQQRLFVAPPHRRNNSRATGTAAAAAATCGGSAGSGNATIAASRKQQTEEEGEEEFPARPISRAFDDDVSSHSDAEESGAAVTTNATATTTTIADHIRMLRQGRQSRTAAGNHASTKKWCVAEGRNTGDDHAEEEEDGQFPDRKITATTDFHCCDELQQRPATSDTTTTSSTDGVLTLQRRASATGGRTRHLSAMFAEREDHRVELDDAWRKKDDLTKKLAQAQSKLTRAERASLRLQLDLAEEEELSMREKIESCWRDEFGDRIHAQAVKFWRDRALMLKKRPCNGDCTHRKAANTPRSSSAVVAPPSVINLTTMTAAPIKDSDLLRALRKAEMRITELERELGKQQPQKTLQTHHHQPRPSAVSATFSSFGSNKPLLQPQQQQRGYGGGGGARPYEQSTPATLMNILYGRGDNTNAATAAPRFVVDK